MIPPIEPQGKPLRIGAGMEGLQHVYAIRLHRPKLYETPSHTECMSMDLAVLAIAWLASAARLRSCLGGGPTKPFSNRCEAVRK
jgi:hypothetical protein